MCDICVLYFLKKKYFYRNKKYQYVDDPDASTSEDEASFPVRSTWMKTTTNLQGARKWEFS